MDAGMGIDSDTSQPISSTSPPDRPQTPNSHVERIEESARIECGACGQQMESSMVATLSEPVEVSSKLLHLPTTRIKSIIKTVPTIQLVNSEAVVLIGKSTELFLSELAREAQQMVLQSGKKTLSIAHIEGVIQTLPQFEFLDGMLS